MYHQPVFEDQVLKTFNPKAGQIYIDATLGNAGHTISLLKSGATVYGIDADSKNLQISVNRIEKLGISKNFTAINDNFRNIEKIHHQFIKKKVDGVLFDLGLSLNQQTSTNRGFSFNDELSLDMRLNPNSDTPSAYSLIKSATDEQLFEIFSTLGQERYSKLISQAIVRTRKHSPFKTARQLADFIKDIYVQNNLPKTKHHPATKVFLALKIYINNELDNLTTALNQSLKLVKPSGIIQIITFHSTEDRLVKNFIKTRNLPSFKVIPTYQQIKVNPLCRSAVLRVINIS